MTPTPEIIRELIEKVEQGSGPDRELDLALIRLEIALLSEDERVRRIDAAWETRNDKDAKSPRLDLVAAWEAATAYQERMLPGWAPASVYEDVGRGFVSSLHGGLYKGSGKSPPRALLSATLRALLSRIQTKGGGDG